MYRTQGENCVKTLLKFIKLLLQMCFSVIYWLYPWIWMELIIHVLLVISQNIKGDSIIVRMVQFFKTSTLLRRKRLLDWIWKLEFHPCLMVEYIFVILTPLILCCIITMYIFNHSHVCLTVLIQKHLMSRNHSFVGISPSFITRIDFLQRILFDLKEIDFRPSNSPGSSQCLAGKPQQLEDDSQTIYTCPSRKNLIV